MEIGINVTGRGCMPSLYGCCGVGEFRGVFEWTDDRTAYVKQGYSYRKIADLSLTGIGYFVATFVPSIPMYQEARKQLDKLHTLVFETPKIKSTSPSATAAGREDGIVLCVYKWGKEE